jgi:DNA-binding MarR family transcriptional regulator
LAPAGLSVSQFSILSLLKVYENVKVSKLAEMLSMERTTLLRALKPLQAAEWVIAGRADRGRSFDVRLSPSGVAKVKEAVPLWENAQAAFEREVGQDRAVRMRNEILELNLGG